VIHLAGPVVLASVLAGAGVYGLIARRNAVLVLVGAELLLASAGVLLVTASALPPGGLSGLLRPDAPPGSVPAADPLLAGQVLTVFAITIAAAEVGVALAVVLLLYRVRRTSDLDAVRELGAASPTYSEDPGAGPEAEPLTGRTGPPEPAATGRPESTDDGPPTSTGDGPPESTGGGPPGPAVDGRSADGPPGTAAAVATGGDR
jgi:NADH-quinone oxidoreductase subunit K